MAYKPPLIVTEILRWAKSHHARTGKWPSAGPERVKESPDLTWRAIDDALRTGNRGLPRTRGLARLLDKHCGSRRLRSRRPRSVG